MNEHGDSFGQYCRNQNNRAVIVNGTTVVLRFRPGYYASNARFRLLFIPANGKYNNKIELKSQQCKIRNQILYVRKKCKIRDQKLEGEILTVLK